MGIGIGADCPLSAVIVSEYVVIVTLWLSPTPVMTDLLSQIRAKKTPRSYACSSLLHATGRSAVG